MKEKCFNHPDKDSISYCKSCAKYFCKDCLSVGKEYYYCNDEKCQLIFNDEASQCQLIDDNVVSISNQRWKEESNKFYKKTIKVLSVLWIILTLFLIIVISPEYYNKIYLLPIMSLVICTKWFIIIYFIRITIYKHFFWERKLSEELAK